jgi:hypothetical protein
MSEETKHTTTTDVVTEKDKGRCAPAPGSGCSCAARIRKEHPDMQPSGGYDEIDELLGLLRVARMNRDSAEAEVLRLRKEMLALTRQAYALPPNIHACKKCGMPGATMHFPGGYLCPDGCKPLPFESPNK